MSDVKQLTDIACPLTIQIFHCSFRLVWVQQPQDAARSPATPTSGSFECAVLAQAQRVQVQRVCICTRLFPLPTFESSTRGAMGLSVQTVEKTLRILNPGLGCKGKCRGKRRGLDDPGSTELPTCICRCDVKFGLAWCPACRSCHWVSVTAVRGLHSALAWLIRACESVTEFLAVPFKVSLPRSRLFWPIRAGMKELL